jgi:hypothetical protein
MKSKIMTPGTIGLMVVLFVLGFLTSGCERTEESFRTQRNEAIIHPNSAAPQVAQLIKQLKGAEELDESEANQKGTSAVAWEDYMVQAGKARKAIEELSYGFEVPKTELDDALWVPPNQLSPAERARLIQQVESALQGDERNESALRYDVAWGIQYSTDAMSRVEVHKAMAEGVLKDLKIGEPVHWQAIQEATQSSEPQE